MREAERFAKAVVLNVRLEESRVISFSDMRCVFLQVDGPLEHRSSR